jgi:putative ABC transport system permease protein
MRKLRAIWMRLLGLLRLRRSHDEFSAELDAHVAMHTEAGIEAGLEPTEARRRALLHLGGAEQVRQAHREGRVLLWLENFGQDIRYGIRTLLRAPGFTITAVLTVGLGIGACTAVFSLVNAVLIRSLPYGDAERLVYLFTPDPRLKVPPEVISPAYGDFYDIWRQSHSFERMSNFEQAIFSVDERGTTQRIGAARVDEDFFQTLKSQPEIGRSIGAEDNRAASAKVAVISHALWVAMFGGRADVLQRAIELDGGSYQIIGVMSPAFEYPFSSDLPYGNSQIKSTQVWVPLVKTEKELAGRDPNDNVSIARLRPGVTVREAQAEMSTIMARLDKEYAGDPNQFGAVRQWGALIRRFTEMSVGPVRPLMQLLMAAVGLVLLIACGNAANLLLARSAERARELGVRAALGAGRARMMRQLLTESLLVGVGGCAVGIALAFLFLGLLPTLDPGNIPRLNEASLDAWVLLVTIGASLATSMMAGLIPAISASRMELTEFLKSHATRGRSGGHTRLQSALIIGQTAMVVVLLAGAGLLIRSYIKVESVDTGFTRSAVTFSVSLDRRYGKPEQRIAFFKQLMAKLEALPGTQAAGSVSNLPLSNSESLSTLWVDGFANKDIQLVEERGVTPHYFAAMNIPLIAGRRFTDADAAATTNRPVIINQKLAETYFRNRNPVGGRITGDPKQARWWPVVGVVADVRHMSLEEVPQPQMYNPSYDADNASVAVRSTLPPATVANEIRATLKAMDKNLAATDIRTMGEMVSMATARRRFQTSLLTVFAGIALIMALVGLYGLMAFSVNRRTREVGIRMALGAERRDVLLLILRNASVLIGCGLGVGLACTWAATRLLKSFLFGVSEHDPVTVILVSGLLVVCGVVAAFVPARRAASIDPMQALRTE